MKKIILFNVLCCLVVMGWSQTPNIPTPTQTDEIIIDNGASGKADPNDRIRYKVTIQNTGGANATGTQLSISPDPRTTFVPGSFRSSPLALPDGYPCTGNVPITIAAASGLKSNDFDDNIAGTTITAGTFATTQGGSITIAADGGFTYTPPAGFTGGTDTYTYTLNDGNGVGGGVPTTDMGVVTFTISNLIWFIDNSSMAATSDGRRNSPFKSLADFNSGSVAAADVIYIEHTGTNYTGGIVLQNTERLFGEGHTGGTNLADVLPFTLAANSVALPAINGSRPFITNSSGTGIQLAMNNTIRGVDAGTTASGEYAMRDNATSVGNLTISDAAISNTLGAFRASAGGTLNVTFSSINATSGGAVNGVFLVSTSGTFDGGTGAISGMTGSPVVITGGTISFTYSGSASQTNNVPLVSILGGHATGTVTFQTGTLSATNGPGLQFDNADGIYNFNGAVTLNGGDAGVDIVNGSGGNFSFLNTNITNPSGAAFLVSGGGGSVGHTGTISKNNAGRIVDIQSRTGGSVTLTGNFSSTGSSTGINVSSCTGGTITFSGSTKTINTGANAGVTLATNTGSTINFTGGGLVVSTTSGTGFSATGGGTVTVQGTGNTINSISATALNVVSTTIGASGLTFESISSGNNTAAADPTKGIILNSTGTGGLTVTGTGTTDGSGGTIQNITTRGAEFITAQNITLKNMNFTSACLNDFPAAPTGLSLGVNTADNAAIHLQSVTTVVLDNLNITGSAEQGINGHNVNGFMLTNSALSGLGNGPDEDGLHFYNMVGTCAITNTSIASSGDDNVNIQNSTTPIAPPVATGTITISGGSFNTGVLGSGLLFGIRGTSNTTIDISGVTINNNFSGGVVADCYDTATMDIEVSATTITNNNDGISLSSHNGNTKFDIHDNSNISMQDFVNIAVQKSAFSTTGTLEGKIRNNTVTTENGHVADGIFVSNFGGSYLKLSMTNNTVNYAGTQRAINVQGGQDGASLLEVTITGNTIDVQLDGTGNAVNGILANSQVADPEGAGSTLCIDIGGAGPLANTFLHSLGGTLAGGDIRVRQRFSANVRLPGYGGGSTDTTAVGTYLDGRNNEVSPSTASFATGTFSGGGACLLPTN